MIDLNTMVSNHIAQKPARSHAKRAFGSIKAQLVAPQYLENNPEVFNVLKLQLALDHHVVYIKFNIFL